MAVKKKMGRCFLVGAGPGDLGLVTLRAKECIEQADLIVYDYLSNPEMLGWARETAEIIYVGKKAGAHTLSQDRINALLVEKAGAGNQVVRLKGGDPFVFGRGGEEAAALAQAKIPHQDHRFQLLSPTGIRFELECLRSLTSRRRPPCFEQCG